MITHFYGIYGICSHFEKNPVDTGFCSVIYAVHNGEKWEVKLNGTRGHLRDLDKEQNPGLFISDDEESEEDEENN